MADEYITKDQAKQAVYEYFYYERYYGASYEAKIDAIPAAYVAPVRHGRWTLTEYPYGLKTYLCSECKDDDWWNGKYAYGDERYCPNCGAKMDKEE